MFRVFGANMVDGCGVGLMFVGLGWWWERVMACCGKIWDICFRNMDVDGKFGDRFGVG